MITQNDIDVLNFIHNRLVGKYEENPNSDYLIKTREIISGLQQELVSGVIAYNGLYMKSWGDSNNGKTLCKDS